MLRMNRSGVRSSFYAMPASFGNAKVWSPILVHGSQPRPRQPCPNKSPLPSMLICCGIPNPGVMRRTGEPMKLRLDLTCRRAVCWHLFAAVRDGCSPPSADIDWVRAATCADHCCGYRDSPHIVPSPQASAAAIQKISRGRQNRSVLAAPPESSWSYPLALLPDGTPCTKSPWRNAPTYR